MFKLVMLVRIGIMAQSPGVSTSILRRWERKDILVLDMRTAGGHRRSETSPSRDHSGQKRAVLYARVSSPGQREDLTRQVATFKTSAKASGMVVVCALMNIGSKEFPSLF